MRETNTNAQPNEYDLVITGGQMIDPETYLTEDSRKVLRRLLQDMLVNASRGRPVARGRSTRFVVWQESGDSRCLAANYEMMLSLPKQVMACIGMRIRPMK